MKIDNFSTHIFIFEYRTRCFKKKKNIELEFDSYFLKVD